MARALYLTLPFYSGELLPISQEMAFGVNSCIQKLQSSSKQVDHCPFTIKMFEAYLGRKLDRWDLLPQPGRTDFCDIIQENLRYNEQAMAVQITVKQLSLV